MGQTFGYGVTVYVDLGLTTGTGGYGVYGTGVYGTATYGPDAEWTDVSAYVRKVDTRRRFMREVSAWETGTAQIVLDNRDGRFDPDHLSGPYVAAGVSQIMPWRPVRIRASYGGVIRPVFQGYILKWPETFPGQVDAEVTISCVDTFALISRYNGFAQTGAGAGELAGQRIHRILNNCSYTGGRAIDPGLVTMAATTLAGNALTEAKLTADTEGGGLWCGADGSVNFGGRYALIENTRSNTSQGTFGDAGGTEVPYTDIVPDLDGNDLQNLVQLARAGGTQQSASDDDSRALFGDQTEGNRSDLVADNDAQILSLAQYLLSIRRNPERRFTSIDLAPAAPTRTATVMPHVLDRQVRDLITVIRRPAGRTAITRSCFISGISHTFNSVDWRTTFELSSATAYQAYQSSRYDTAVYGTAVYSY